MNIRVKKLFFNPPGLRAGITTTGLRGLVYYVAFILDFTLLWKKAIKNMFKFNQ